MYAPHDESDESATISLRTEHAHSRQFGEPFSGIGCQRRIVRENGWTANLFEKINRTRPADRARDIVRASFEAMRRFFVCALLQGNADDHLAAAVPGRYRFEYLSATIE